MMAIEGGMERRRISPLFGRGPVRGSKPGRTTTRTHSTSRRNVLRCQKSIWKHEYDVLWCSLVVNRFCVPKSKTDSQRGVSVFTVENFLTPCLSLDLTPWCGATSRAVKFDRWQVFVRPGGVWFQGFCCWPVRIRHIPIPILKRYHSPWLHEAKIHEMRHLWKQAVEWKDEDGWFPNRFLSGNFCVSFRFPSFLLTNDSSTMLLMFILLEFTRAGTESFRHRSS